MLAKLFVGKGGRLRNGYWIAIFLAGLAALLFPLIVLSDRFHFKISIWQQLALIFAVTCLCQLLRRRSLFEIMGPIDGVWIRDLLAGVFVGAVLMTVPAALMLACGWVSFTMTAAGLPSLGLAVFAMLGVAVAEELLFRGFMFQRTVDGLGEWPGLILLGGLFLLTHFDNAGMHGVAASLAMANIFVAGVMFGLAVLATRRLALPIGIHFGANVCQGNILGFAVSGTEGDSLFLAHLKNAPEWLTGGTVGIEGSLFGLIGVTALAGGLWWYRRRARSTAPA